MSTRPSHAAGQRATLTQVRNATLRVDYGGVRFLVDPMLADKGAYPGFEGTANATRWCHCPCPSGTSSPSTR